MKRKDWSANIRNSYFIVSSDKIFQLDINEWGLEVKV